MNLTNLCRELKNYFEKSKHFGDFTVSGKKIDLSKLVADGSLHSGQFIRIVGSAFNDGIYQYSPDQIESLHDDETFRGAIWILCIPPEIIELETDIEAWNAKYASNDQIDSPYSSESFGGYSYSKGSSTSNGADFGTWQSQFRSRLNRWRKI